MTIYPTNYPNTYYGPANEANPKTYLLTLQIRVDANLDAFDAVRQVARTLPPDTWWQLKAWTDKWAQGAAIKTINGGGQENAQIFINENR